MPLIEQRRALTVRRLSTPAAVMKGESETHDLLVRKYQIQAHYLAHQCVLGETGIFSLVAHLPAVPVAIFHGRLDFVCQPENAKRLQQAIPGSRLAWADGAGHDPFHPAMSSAWITFLRHFSEEGNFDISEAGQKHADR